MLRGILFFNVFSILIWHFLLSKEGKDGFPGKYSRENHFNPKDISK